MKQTGTTKRRSRITFEEHLERAGKHLRAAATMAFNKDHMDSATELREMAIKAETHEYPLVLQAPSSAQLRSGSTNLVNLQDEPGVKQHG